MPFKFRDYKKRLEFLDYEIVRQNGSHVIFKKGKHMISLPFHGGKDISPGLEKSVLKKLNLDAEKFRNLLKNKKK